MKKTLISVDNLDEHICRELGRLYVDGNTILTAGAKDELTRRHIAIVRCSDVETEKQHCAPACGNAQAGCVQHELSGHEHGAHEHGGHGQALPSDVADMLVGVAAILQKECGIHDPEELKNASLRVFKAIKASL